MLHIEAIKPSFQISPTSISQLDFPSARSVEIFFFLSLVVVILSSPIFFFFLWTGRRSSFQLTLVRTLYVCGSSHREIVLITAWSPASHLSSLHFSLSLSLSLSLFQTSPWKKKKKKETTEPNFREGKRRVFLLIVIPHVGERECVCARACVRARKRERERSPFGQSLSR